MATFDIFNNDAFTQQQLLEGVMEAEFQPTFLGGLGIFTPKPIRTEVFSIEKKQEKLSLVQTSLRGAPLEQGTQEKRNIRDFRTNRIAKGDVLTASELAFIRAFGSETEIQAVQGELASRIRMIQNDIALTEENMRLGAIMGKVLDADGSTIIDWHKEWGNNTSVITSVAFTMTSNDGTFRDEVNKMVRTMARDSFGSFTPSSRVVALCGDDFYDALLKMPDFRDAYKNNISSASVIPGGDAFGAVEIPGISGVSFVNYRGTDDNSTVKIPDGEAYFVATNTNNAFYHVMSPGEQFSHIGTPGQQYYPLLIRDEARDMKVDVELYTYPLFMTTAPKMLRKGTIA